MGTRRDRYEQAAKSLAKRELVGIARRLHISLGYGAGTKEGVINELYAYNAGIAAVMQAARDKEAGK